jgi:glycosyltransferase involved in cell wall biosynthesis
MRICFLLSGLSRSGGVNAVIQHSRWLRKNHGCEITLVLLDGKFPEDDFGLTEEFQVTLLQDLPKDIEPFDVAIATYWESAFWIYEVPAAHYAHFVQSLEDRFFPPRTPNRMLARISQGLPLTTITEASWIAEVMEDVGSEPVHLVPNGVDKEVFAPLEEIPAPHGGPLRVLVEGHPAVWFKSVPEANDVIEQMSSPHEAVFVVPNPDESGEELTAGRALGPLTAGQMAEQYEWADVILKLSRVEGMFGPPLEAFHKGATCVVWPVTGHDQYIEHRVNGVVTDWDDLKGTARWLDLLAEDRKLLARLQSGALQTAKAWPGWPQAAERMHEALGEILAEPRVDDPARFAQLSESIRAATGPAERYAAAMGLMEGEWSVTHERVWQLEAEVERMGGRRRERARRLARRVYRRLRPVQQID